MKRVDKLTADSGELKDGKRLLLNRQLLVSGQEEGLMMSRGRADNCLFEK